MHGSHFYVVITEFASPLYLLTGAVVLWVNMQLEILGRLRLVSYRFWLECIK